jgi:integrase
MAPGGVEPPPADSKTIEPRDVKAYAERVAARGVAPNTVRLALAPVKALLATAVEEGLIRFNPSVGLRLAAGRQEEAEEEHAKALTEEELGEVLAAIPSAMAGSDSSDTQKREWP